MRGRGSRRSRVIDQDAPLDALDAALFRLLAEDGRRGYRDIATELGVPEATSAPITSAASVSDPD